MTLMEAMVRGGVYYCYHLVLTTDNEIGLCLHSSKLCSCAMYIYTISMPIHVYLVHCDFLSVFIPLSCNYAPHTISVPMWFTMIFSLSSFLQLGHLTVWMEGR